MTDIKATVKGLTYSVMDAGIYHGITTHAQQDMKDLGIEYELAVPQSMFDSWQFFAPKNVPDELPSYLTWFECDPFERVGWGLSEEMAKKLIEVSQETSE